MVKDVIGLRVRLEVKNAWDSLTDSDKDRIKAIVEELILLHSAGFSVEMVKRELDSLRTEVCPWFIKIVEYYRKSGCINGCYDSNVRNYINYLHYYVQKLCKYYPAKPQAQGVKNDRGVVDSRGLNP